MNLTNAQDIKALLERYGFHFSRSMGQNFLIDGRVPHDIAEAAGLDKSCAVLQRPWPPTLMWRSSPGT